MAKKTAKEMSRTERKPAAPNRRFSPARFLVSEKFEIVQSSGSAALFIEASRGDAGANLQKKLREGLPLNLRKALQRARRTGRVTTGRLAVKQHRGTREVEFEVIPLRPSRQVRFFLVTLNSSKPAAENGRAAQLERQLEATREHLQSVIEDREAANEELQSSAEEILANNEELQSMNEELETAKEELLSTNEQLVALNKELRNRNAELSRMNDDLGNLFSSVNVGILMLDKQLRIRRFTPTAGGILNLTPSDAGRPLADLRAGIVVEDLSGLVAGVIESTLPLEREVTDRKGRWYTMSIRPYRTADNRIDGAVLSLVSVEAIKRSLEETRRARSFSQEIIDSVDQPLIVLDRELRITLANPAVERAFGISPEAARGLNVEGLAAGMSVLARMLRPAPAGGSFEREIEIPGKGLFLATAWPVRAGERDGLTLLVLSDITERKRAEKVVRLSEALYRELFEQSFNSTTEGILLLDANSGEITGINPYLAKLLAIGAEQATGKHVWEVAPLRTIAGSQSAFLKRRASLRFDELTISASDGRAVPVTIAASLYQAGGRHIIQLNFRDLGPRKYFEEQFRQAHKMEAIGRLAGGVAHDFNNLLTVIAGNAEVLLERLEPDDPLLEEAGEILKAANRAASLTRKLLTFSRHDVVDVHPLDLNSVAGSILGMLERLVGERIAVRLEPAPGLRAMAADENQIEQVILNLVLNSRDAMPNGGSIAIRTANVELDEEFTKNRVGLAPGAYVMLEISDTGAGMSEEALQHIFEPFFTTKPVGKGTGLGLATVYAIAKQGGGDVMVESRPGMGTTVRVYFPAVGQAAAPSGRKSLARAAPLRGTETVLVVEDDAGVRRLVAEILTGLGYDVLEAGDGPEALEAARSRKVDLLLTDMVMPRMNGQDLAGSLREEQPGVRVLFISGYTLEDIGRPPAADVFLPKPFSREELARKVREVLESEGQCPD